MEFRRHYSSGELEKLFDAGFTLPDDFLFGVANAAFQVEGGYNSEGGPLNNWADYEHEGKVEKSGEAVRFWTEYPEHVELAKGMNLNAFRMSIEWARVQPQPPAGTGGARQFDQ